jgi:hypothetical protein
MAKNQQDIMAVGIEVAKAFGGGVAAEIVADLVNQNAPDWVAKNPKLAEAIPAAAAFAGLYFLPDTKDRKLSAVFLGMAGAAGAGLSDDIIQMAGISRSAGRMNGYEDEYKKGLEFIEKLQKKGFEADIIQGNFTGRKKVSGWG